VDDIVCVRVADFDRDNFLVAVEPPTLRAIEPSQLKTRQLRKGDLLIEKSGGGEKQLVGCVVSFNHDFKAVCSNFVARMPVVPEFPPRFWCYVHAALYAGKLNYPAIKQTTGIQNLDSSAYLDTPAPFPGISEQQSIAAFLDRETGRLDQLMAKKRELMERLKEKRTALISRTVTRGLPPAAARAASLPENPPLKPSGTEWLGEIPEHWEVKKGRYVGTLFGSASSSEDELIEDDSIQDSDLPFAKVDDLNQIDGSLKLVSTKARVRGCRARPGAFLLFPKRGAAIFTNKVAITEKPLLFDPNLMGWQINSAFAQKFVAYCLIARRLDDLADVSTVPQINNKHIYPAAFPRPPLPEQAAIAAYLDKETAKLDALVGKVETAVERLQEYRTALITAAVTGKIDVREAVV
jgi:type I restriction enzyme S subunit